MPRDKRVTYVIDEMGIVRAAFRHECIVSLHMADLLAFLHQHRADAGRPVGKLASQDGL
jgi:hypothetical protein